MIIIRPIAQGDLEGYQALALQAHINFYTLPKNPMLLEKFFQKGIRSFSKDADGEFYLFVAEDLEAKKLIGVSAISAISGEDNPLYFFKREVATTESALEQVVKQHEVLTPISYVRGPSEVCSLFLDPAYRGKGVGKLLSLSRFLFAAAFPDYFTGSFISELRGPLDDSTSPFWDAIGRRFFDASFDEVEEMMNYGRSFIGQFLPQYPIYVDLLPKEIQECIGKVDKDTQAAFSLLTKLGFEVTDEIDLIDGGPKLLAKRENILPIAQSQKVVVEKLVDSLDDHSCLLSNDRLDFRAVDAPLTFLSPDSIAITKETAACLQVGLQDSVRVYDYDRFK